MIRQNIYLIITPFFPSNESFVGSYVYDQITEIKSQSNFGIEIVKVVSYFSSESDYEFNGFKVKTFKTFDFPYFIFPGLFNSFNKRRFSKFLQNKNITNPAAIVGMGGGITMDIAKAVSILLTNVGRAENFQGEGDPEKF